MYLHLGQNTVVNSRDIIGIFDLDNATVNKATRDFLKLSEQQHRVVNVTYELPKTFVVCKKKRDKKSVVYISQLASATLQKRAGQWENGILQNNFNFISEENEK